MDFNKHRELEGRHALLSPSKYNWINKEPDEVLDMYARSYAQAIGTALHDIAAKRIEKKRKLKRGVKDEIYFLLLSYYKIPYIALERGIDFDQVFETMTAYVNDAIGYRMVPEQELKYSDICFGTADAINQLDNIVKNRKLQIHDLKTGITPAHIEQLEIYAALFCLEYHFKPSDLDIELRIYQGDQVVTHQPEVDEIVPIMDTIISDCKHIERNTEA